MMMENQMFFATHTQSIRFLEKTARASVSHKKQKKYNSKAHNFFYLLPPVSSNEARLTHKTNGWKSHKVRTK